MLVIAGSLGAGKTTLLRRLLSGRHGRIAALVNEFGELGIDGGLVAGENVDMIELTGGCVCCSLAGEFHAAVREIVERFAPERIAVETTGVAEADALVMDIEDELPEARLETVVVLVDADVAARFPQFGYTESSQLESADLVLVNKTDLVDDEALDTVRSRVRAVNDRALLLGTVHAEVDPALLWGERAGQPGRGHGRTGSGPVRDHGMATFHWCPAGTLRRACFESAVDQWPGAVYRAKGRVPLDGSWFWFSYVAGRWHLDAAERGEPGLVWIGPRVDQHASEILAALEQCIE